MCRTDVKIVPAGNRVLLLTFLQVLHFRTNVLHNSHELMTHNVSAFHARHEGVVHVKVGATNACSGDFENHICLYKISKTSCL